MVLIIKFIFEFYLLWFLKIKKEIKHLFGYKS